MIRPDSVRLMIRAAFIYLLATVIAAHGALGCCWHTACAECVSPSAALTQDEHPCKHDHDYDQSPRSSEPCKCRLECEGVCNALAPKKIEPPKAAFAVAFLPAVWLVAAIGQPGPVERRVSTLEIAGSASPLRAHLRLCVLLI
jgi:hypothetical protein